MSVPNLGPDSDRFRAHMQRAGARTITGYVYDVSDFTARLVVELLLDGIPVGLARSEHFVEALSAAGIGDARYGFAFTLTPEILAGGRFAQISAANRGVLPVAPLDLWESVDGLNAAEWRHAVGAVAWTGGLELTGWLSPIPGTGTPTVTVSIDGRIVAEALADRWQHRVDAGGVRPVHAFSLHLPDRLADGRTKRLSVMSEQGAPLRGSPVSLLAFPEPLEICAARAYGPDTGVVGERARLFDRLLPRSTPLHALERWLIDHPAPVIRPTPVAIALIGANPVLVSRTVDSLKAQPALDWLAVALPSDDGIGFRHEDLTRFADTDAHGRTALIVAPAGTVFPSGAVARFAAVLASDTAARLVYGDITVGSPGRETLLAFSAFDYERWLEQGYGALVFALPPSLVAPSGATSLYSLACAAFDADRRRDVVHLPGLTARVPALDRAVGTRHLAAATRAHLAARGFAGRVIPSEGALLPAVRVERAGPPSSVTVIVMTRDRGDALRTCLASIRAELAAPLRDLLIVDAGSSDPTTLELFAALQRDGVRILREHGPMNHAELYNRAVAHVNTTFVLFLDPEVVAGSAGWLDELLGRALDPGVDAVGGVIQWPSGVIRHAGIVLGPGFATRERFDDRIVGDPGYGDLLRVASEPGALSSACLLLRRDAYWAVGGMDATCFPRNYHAIDLCLKLRARGGSLVVTPHLRLCRDTPPGHDVEPTQDAVRLQARELAILRDRWGPLLEQDPAYSPLLALSDQPYSGLASPPRDQAPRRHAPPRPQIVPFGR